MTAPITLTPNVDFVAEGEVESLAALKDAIKDPQVFGGIHRGHAQSTTTSFITKSPSAPSNPSVGDYWDDTTNGRLKRWSGTDWVDVGAAVQATPPSSPSVGDLWYDTTLGLLRAYETKHEITGWHPVAAGFQLWQSPSATIATARIVQPLSTSDALTDHKATAATEKSTTAFGVTVEEIATGGSGVVAMFGGEALVDVEVHVGAVTGGSNAAVAKDDWIVSYDGRGRTLGGPPSDYWGLPKGVCGVAAEAASVTGTIKVKLLPAVGQGAFRHFNGRALIVDLGDTLTSPGSGTYDAATAFGGTYIELNASDPPAGGTVVDAKHEPIEALSLDVRVEGDVNGAPGSYAGRLTFSINGVTVHHEMEMAGYGNSTDNYIDRAYGVRMGVAGQSGFERDAIFQVKGDAITNGANTVDGIWIYCTGYWYQFFLAFLCAFGWT